MMRKNLLRGLGAMVAGILLFPSGVYGAAQIGLEQTGSIQTAAPNAYAAAKAGDYLYVTTKEGGLEVFDVSNPAQPVKAEVSADTFAEPTIDGKGSVYYDGAYLYVAFDRGEDNNRHIRQYSLENPLVPTVVKDMTGYSANDMFTHEGWLYTSNNSERMYGYQLDNTTTKRFFLANTAATAGYNDTLFVAYNNSAGDSGIFAFDISNPGGLYPNKTLEKWEIPLATGELCRGYRYFESGVKFNQLKVSGNYLYISDTASKKIYRVDVSDPQNLSEESRWEDFFIGNTETLNAFTVDENYLYVHQGTTLSVLDLRTGSLLASQDTGAGCGMVLVDNGTIYIPTKSSSVTVLTRTERSVSIDPIGVSVNTLERVSAYSDTDTKVRLYGMAQYQNYLYVAGREAGIMIFDISDPASPQFVKNAGISVSTRPERGALAVKDNYLYCAFMGEKVIKKFDLTDPLNIKQVAEFTGVTYDLKKVVVTDRYVIAGNGSNTARWVDTTGSAEEPAVVSADATFDLGNVFHIVRSGDYIYCMDRDGQIRMYDSTAEPGGNGRIGNLVNANNMKDSSDNKNYDEQALTMDEAGYLYGINGNRLTVYDAGENSRDFFTEGNYKEYQFEELANARDCFVRAGSLYVLSASNQVTIFDVSDPMNPVLKNSGVGVNADGGYVNGEYLYLTLPGGPQSGEKLCTYRFVQTVQSDGSNTVQQLPLTITGKASGCETVAVSVDDGEATTVPVQNGKWSYTVETLSAGYHTVKAAIPDTSAAETMEIYMPEALVRDFAFSASALTGGETLTVNCTVTNLGSNAMRPLLMIGLFKNGELVDVGLQQTDVPGSGTQAMTASIELPEDVSGCTAQAFIWSDGQTIRPLSSSIEIQ